MLNPSNPIIEEDGSVLSDQIKLLSDILNEVLIEQSGRSLFQLEETIRLLTKSYRESSDTQIAMDDLRTVVGTLSHREKMIMVKVFSIFFRLVLVLEERYITRAIEEGRRASSMDSLQSAVQYGKKLGLRATDVISLLDLNSIKLVFTDHPTGGVQDLLENNLRAIYSYMQLLDNPVLNELTRQKYISKIKYHITLLWQSTTQGDRQNRVDEKVRSLLYFFDSSIVEAISNILDNMSRVISHVYSDEIETTGKIDYRVPSFISVGSNVGGDLRMLSDPSESYDTIILQKQQCLRIYLQKVDLLITQLSNSSEVIGVSRELEKGLEADAKLFPELAYRIQTRHRSRPYRQKLEFVRAKLLNTLSVLEVDNDELVYEQRGREKEGPIYYRSIDLLRDLRQIQNSLKRHKAKIISNGPLRDLINLIKIFGFHLASIDFIQDASLVFKVLNEIFAITGMGDLDQMTLAQRMNVLREELESQRPLGILNHIDKLSPESFSFIESLLIIKDIVEKISPRAVGSFILDNCNDESQVIGLLLISKELNLSVLGEQSSIDIVPRFSEYSTLINGSRFFKSLFMNPNYMTHLQNRGYIQEIYLDFTNYVKRLGFFSAHLEIFKIKRDLIELFGRFKIRPRFFLGRGGAVSRGFKASQLGLMAQPIGSMGNIKIEENGEIMSSLFANPELTSLNLELVANGLLVHTINDKFMLGMKNPSMASPRYTEVLEKLAKRNREVYTEACRSPMIRELFRHSTPSDLLAHIMGVENDFTDFPCNIDDRVWIHSWNQSRNIFPMYFGVGTALSEHIEETGISILAEMYQNWPFFRSLINYLQMVLTKMDFKLMDVYHSLCHMEEESKELLDTMRHEYLRTKKAVLRITGQEVLMEGDPAIREAILRRLPHLDSIGILQVSLLKDWRATGDPKYLKGLIPTVNAIIAGLKNTG